MTIGTAKDLSPRAHSREWRLRQTCDWIRIIYIPFCRFFAASVIEDSSTGGYKYNQSAGYASVRISWPRMGFALHSLEQQARRQAINGNCAIITGTLRSIKGCQRDRVAGCVVVNKINTWVGIRGTSSFAERPQNT